MHCRKSASWRASETRIASRCNSHNVVLPTISVKRNVTVPTGNGIVEEAGTDEVICRNLGNRSQNREASTLAERSAAQDRRLPGKVYRNVINEAGGALEFPDLHPTGNSANRVAIVSLD